LVSAAFELQLLYFGTPTSIHFGELAFGVGDLRLQLGSDLRLRDGNSSFHARSQTLCLGARLRFGFCAPLLALSERPVDFHARLRLRLRDSTLGVRARLRLRLPYQTLGVRARLRRRLRD
jgi:hypothetical protein